MFLSLSQSVTFKDTSSCKQTDGGTQWVEQDLWENRNYQCYGLRTQIRLGTLANEPLLNNCFEMR